MPYVRQLPLGPMKNFVYLVGAANAPEVAVIDPAWDVPAIAKAVEEDGKKLTAVVLSHHHSDHVNGVAELLRSFDVPVYAQRAEVEFSEVIRSFSDAVKKVGQGEVVRVGPMEMTMVHTPGHTPGSQCVLCGGALISGDTVFVNACGRCDFPGGDPEQMFKSLNTVLGALPGETVLYPGHDYGDVKVSSLERERANNPYFLLHELPAFLEKRKGPKH